jgi:nicotinate-nucleotide--dimethylbenzimidazole phosphoribosyltransferase
MSSVPSALPFDDIRDLVARMPGSDAAAVAAVRARDGQLTKPPGSLGRLETLTEWVAAWSGRAQPRIQRPVVCVFAGNHGVTDRGVSAFPREVTRQMVENFAAGGAAINQLCLAFDFGLKVLDLALDHPTPDIVVADAFDEVACAATMAFGMEAVAGGIDLLMIGEMGIGNTTVAAAIYHALYGGRPEDWVGRGTGVDDDGFRRKCDVVGAAVDRIGSARTNPLEVLRRIGGREFAAMAGAIIAARHERIPVIVDGYVAGAAAAVVHAMAPGAIDHVEIAHVSAEGGHAEAVRRMGKAAILDLGMRLGEGSGAALAGAVVKAAVATHAGMATFGQAGVAEKER